MTTGTPPIMDEPRLRLTVQRRRKTPFMRRWALCSLALASLLSTAGVISLALPGNIGLPFERVVTLKGIMASKGDFFEDEETQRILMKHHFRVDNTSVGSRRIATSNLDGFDFALLSGQPAAEAITEERARSDKHNKPYSPFVSPIVLATFREHAEALQDAKVAKAHVTPGHEAPLYYTVDMEAFLELIQSGRRWVDIGVESGNRIVAHTPDICEANSAGSYLALVAFVANGNDNPTTGQRADELARKIKDLLILQGLPTPDLFPLYKAPEGTSTPIVVVYEHQYLEYQTQYEAESGTPDPDRVLLYPDPYVLPQPVFLSLEPAADRLGELIDSDHHPDPELQRRAMQLGFRVLDSTGATTSEKLFDYLEDRGIPAPPLLTEASTSDTRAIPPQLDLLERMIEIVRECPPANQVPGQSG